MSALNHISNIILFKKKNATDFSYREMDINIAERTERATLYYIRSCSSLFCFLDLFRLMCANVPRVKIEEKKKEKHFCIYVRKEVTGQNKFKLRAIFLKFTIV